ncbi:GftB: Glycosyl transferase, family 8 [Staphylococcus gallinarum]|uniref:GftB: Glycosyl transferase, family 8 n=1 Tax=Staphylococcus gallinarum TaxID=1293 RepID=A0A380FPD9_STAGA|nr:GftB: Glycosyl transferase, family 8 [Staphylococcus gallinarum]
MIHIPEQDEYQTITNQLADTKRKQIIPSGYLYKYKKKNRHTKEALIMTNSDQLLNIELFFRKNVQILHFTLQQLPKCLQS